jgi:hypothetical protein
MSNNKQSSVEFIEQVLQGYGLSFQGMIEQAKVIHKEEIIEAASDHCYPICELARNDAEQYYNDTYGK